MHRWLRLYARPALSISSPATGVGTPNQSLNLACRPIAFDAIPRPAWERLFDVTVAATPFSRWTVHRAWWDAYGRTAHEQYLVCVAEGTGDGSAASNDIRAIVPLMHRHEVEQEDGATATVLRRHSVEPATTPVRGDAKAVFFGAAYHTDYATLLAAPDDLPAVAQAVVRSLASAPDPGHGNQRWDVVDLRRLRTDDPVLPALETAFRAVADQAGWQVTREHEDVCPVLTSSTGDWDQYLATLRKKDRHEIRRKCRRAAAAGEVSVDVSPATPAGLEQFIELHQARFGAEGLFPPTEGGARSRRFVERLVELEAAEPDGGRLRLAQVRVGGRLIFTALVFEDEDTCFLYNAGMDSSAADLSPGVVGTAAYLRDRLAQGKRRFDFLRGDEPYKYEWGAHDEVIERLLVVRS